MKKLSTGFKIWMCFLLGGSLFIYLSIVVGEHFFSPWARLPASASEIHKPPFDIGINTPVIMKARLDKSGFLIYVKQEEYVLGDKADLKRFYNQVMVTGLLTGPQWWAPPFDPELVAYKEDEYGMGLMIYKDGWLFYETGMFPR